MNIFSTLDLNSNNINNAVIGTDKTNVAGAIAYDSTEAKLCYYNGTTWVSVGGSETIVNTVSGKYFIEGGSGRTLDILVNSDSTKANTISMTSTGKGDLTLSRAGITSEGQTTSLMTTLNINNIYSGEITVENNKPVIVANHNLGTYDIVVQVYEKTSKQDATDAYSLVQVDVNLVSNNTVNIVFSGTSYAGTYKVVIYTAQTSTLTLTNSTL